MRIATFVDQQWSNFQHFMASYLHQRIQFSILGELIVSWPSTFLILSKTLSFSFIAKHILKSLLHMIDVTKKKSKFKINIFFSISPKNDIFFKKNQIEWSVVDKFTQKLDFNYGTGSILLMVKSKIGLGWSPKEEKCGIYGLDNLFVLNGQMEGKKKNYVEYRVSKF